MSRAKLIAGWLIIVIVTADGIYRAFTAETTAKLQGGLGVALLGAAFLAGLIWSVLPRKAASKFAMSEIGDVVVFARHPFSVVAVSIFLATVALGLFFMERAGIHTHRAWLASVGKWIFAVFAVLSLILPWRITLRLTPQSLDHSPWPVIPWTEIRKLSRKSSAGHDAIVLHLREPEKFRSRGWLKRLLGGAGRNTGKPDFVILPFLVGGDTDRIAREISRRILAFGVSRAAASNDILPNTSSEAP